ncbi:MAG: HlyD family efflux transporter periplasmic adaptor subunit [Syntrophaceae bacterium]|nr:HlyD family efflux transporter periplasmic adaptor subunit [Syntrophaceae bacterium]
MPQFDTDNPKKRVKAYGVLLACLVAVASLALLVVTQEPKKAVSSPVPAKAAIVPQIADAKSEAEIIFRGKSFSDLQRKILMPYGGEILSIEAKEGQSVNLDNVLVKYKLDRQSMIQVHQILFPSEVLRLKNALFDQQINLDKLNKVSLPLKQIALDKALQELNDIKTLNSKGLADDDAVTNKEREVESSRKQVLEVKETIKQSEDGIRKTEEDLKFFESKRKRDLDLLEYQTKRSYSNTDLPLDIAFLASPIDGQVIWLSPELRVNSELPTGTPVVTVATTHPMVVRCKVHELDLVKLKTGDRGSVTFDAIPEKRFPCKVSRIPWVSRNPALESPADYEIECLLDNTDGKIKDGLTCNVKISVTQ